MADKYFGRWGLILWESRQLSSELLKWDLGRLGVNVDVKVPLQVLLSSKELCGGGFQILELVGDMLIFRNRGGVEVNMRSPPLEMYFWIMVDLRYTSPA